VAAQALGSATADDTLTLALAPLRPLLAEAQERPRSAVRHVLSDASELAALPRQITGIAAQAPRRRTSRGRGRLQRRMAGLEARSAELEATRDERIARARQQVAAFVTDLDTTIALFENTFQVECVLPAPEAGTSTVVADTAPSAPRPTRIEDPWPPGLVRRFMDEYPDDGTERPRSGRPARNPRPEPGRNRPPGRRPALRRAVSNSHPGSATGGGPVPDRGPARGRVAARSRDPHGKGRAGPCPPFGGSVVRPRG
jgi:hypothetical protein